MAKKKKDRRGGYRPGAGARPNYHKKASVVIENIHELYKWVTLQEAKKQTATEQPIPLINEENLPDEDLNRRLRRLEKQLGLAEKPEPAVAVPDSSEPKRFPACSLPTPSPPPPPEIISDPPSGQSRCDSHGCFTPKSKADPRCPECVKLWEAQSKSDERYLSRLLPGVGIQ